jgi:acyl carrier protein
MSKIDARLRELLADLLDVEVPVAGDIRFDALPGWDSITHLHLLMDVEQTFELEIPDEHGMELDSLDRLHAYVRERSPGADLPE